MYGWGAPEPSRWKVKISRKMNSCLWLLLSIEGNSLNPPKTRCFVLILIVSWLSATGVACRWRHFSHVLGVILSFGRFVNFLQGWNHKHLNTTDPPPIERRLTGEKRPADHWTYSTWRLRSCRIVRLICGQLWSDRQFSLDCREKCVEGSSQGGLWKSCYPHFNRHQIAGSFRPGLFVHSRCLCRPLCCLMGSWPRGKGYSLSFLQLAFTVSLAELMHHIFEAQVPCAPLSDCGRDLTDSLDPFQPALWDATGEIPWRIQFQANYYLTIKCHRHFERNSGLWKSLYDHEGVKCGTSQINGAANPSMSLFLSYLCIKLPNGSLCFVALPRDM